MEESPDLGPSATPAQPVAPVTPKRNAEAKDANPWEASWADLLSSQESDTEFDTDSRLSATSTDQDEQAAAPGVLNNTQASPSTTAASGS